MFGLEWSRFASRSWDGLSRFYACSTFQPRHSWGSATDLNYGKRSFSFLTLCQLKHVREPLAYCTSHADRRHGTLFMGRGCNISLLIFKGIWEMHSLGLGLGCGRRGKTSHAVTWSEVLVELTGAQWPTWGRMATLSPTHIRSDGSWPCQWFIAVQLQMNIAPSCPTVYRSCTGLQSISHGDANCQLKTSEKVFSIKKKDKEKHTSTLQWSLMRHNSQLKLVSQIEGGV